MFHSDGDKMLILDDLVNIGIDAINPIEPTCNMTVGGIKTRYPDLVVTSMIDCDQLLPFGTPEEVEVACKQAIDDGARGGSFLLGSSSELHPDAKLENFLKMREVALGYGQYSNKDRLGRTVVAAPLMRAILAKKEVNMETWQRHYAGSR